MPNRLRLCPVLPSVLSAAILDPLVGCVVNSLPPFSPATFVGLVLPNYIILCYTVYIVNDLSCVWQLLLNEYRLIDWLIDWERIPRIIQSTTLRYSSNLSQRVGLQLFSVLWICRVRVKSKAIYLHAGCVWQSRSLLSRHIPFVSIMCFEARSIRSLFSVRSTLIRKVKLSKNKKLSWCWQTRATHLPRVWFPISVL